MLQSLLREGMRRRFSGPPGGTSLKVTFKHWHDDMSAESFRITVGKGGVTIEGQVNPNGADYSSFHRGVSCLVNLVQVRNGKLALPTGVLVSRPATAWRGVHLFVGPDALDFHKKLWTRVLLLPSLLVWLLPSQSSRMSRPWQALLPPVPTWQPSWPRMPLAPRQLPRMPIPPIHRSSPGKPVLAPQFPPH